MRSWQDTFTALDGIATFVQSIDGLITSRYCVTKDVMRIVLSIVWNGSNSLRKNNDLRGDFGLLFFLA
jgi:hypothetical protein